jgi:hypothetical protein
VSLLEGEYLESRKAVENQFNQMKAANNDIAIAVLEISERLGRCKEDQDTLKKAINKLEKLAAPHSGPQSGVHLKKKG